jgi:hypothetical protein
MPCQTKEGAIYEAFERIGLSAECQKIGQWCQKIGHYAYLCKQSRKKKQ